MIESTIWRLTSSIKLSREFVDSRRAIGSGCDGSDGGVGVDGMNGWVVGACDRTVDETGIGGARTTGVDGIVGRNRAGEPNSSVVLGWGGAVDFSNMLVNLAGWTNGFAVLQQTTINWFFLERIKNDETTWPLSLRVGYSENHRIWMVIMELSVL